MVSTSTMQMMTVLVLCFMLTVGRSLDVPLGGDFWHNTRANGTLWGYVDLHTHPMNADGFGGHLYSGKLSGPLAKALADCSKDHGKGLNGNSLSITPEMGHKTQGYGDFSGWPKRSTLVHQQMHEEWLHRAYQSGLRVIHADIGNSEFLADSFQKLNSVVVGKNPLPSTDSAVIPIELKTLNDFLERNGEWAAVAHNSTELKQIVASNKMAIVIGMELDTPGAVLGVQHWNGTMTDARVVIAKNLGKLYALGVRHMFGIHLVNSVFGGTAFYSYMFDLNNYWISHEFFNVTNGWDRGARFRLDLDTTATEWVLRIFEGIPKPKWPQLEPPFSHVNGNGLSPLGVILYQEMMKLGMIVDLDHSGSRSKDEILTMAESIGYPVIASHSRPRSIKFGANATTMYDNTDAAHKLYHTSNPEKVTGERDLSDSEMKRMAALGGLLGSQISTKGVEVGFDLPQNCDGSTTAWVSVLQKEESIMGPGGVGFGTDTNGFAGISDPRFGMLACKTASDGDKLREAVPSQQAKLQRRGVTYTTNITDAGDWRFKFKGSSYAYPTKKDREIWQAIARFMAKSDLSLGPAFERHIAVGLNASASGLPFPHKIGVEGQAAYLAYRCSTCNATFGGSVGTQIREIWGKWLEFAGPEPNNVPLQRMVLGNSERDINLDGFATIGQFPDLLQDAKNLGANLKGVFQSAQRYYDLWAKSESLAEKAQQKWK